MESEKVTATVELEKVTATVESEKVIATTKATKRLFLVRHSESVNNVDKRQFKQRWGHAGLLSGKIPPASSFKQVGRLLSIPMNTPLSPNGENMIEEQRKILEADDFLEKNDIQVIFHSHLQRARTTCQGLFLTMAERRKVIPIKEHPNLYERGIAENFGVKKMRDRIHNVCLGLLEQPEDRILLVGHSAFFREMLGGYDGKNVNFDNCDVWTTLLNTDLTCTETALMYKGGHALLSSQTNQ